MNYQLPVSSSLSGSQEAASWAAQPAFPQHPQVVVVGLGYVGLPLAAALARYVPTAGFDIDEERVCELKRFHDRTGEVTNEQLAGAGLAVHSDPVRLAIGDVYIVTVPTPVDDRNDPDLQPLLAACGLIGRLIDPARRSIIVFESTVYPGVTEQICGPAIEAASGLTRGEHFFLGYSPERINPGDREHSIERITKVVAGETDEVTDYLAMLYGRITSGGVFRAKSIKVAEAAKVIENAQRDINVAFMNEISQIFGKLGISALDVLETARTKWNFLPFRPGLVGGHCIGVDPYYLSHCALGLGHLPRVILAGRSINDGMANWIADSIHSLRASRTGSVLVLGATFKENVSDLRNSKVVDLVRRLEWLGHRVIVHDPHPDPMQAEREYGLRLTADALEECYDVLIGAVMHRAYLELDTRQIEKLLKPEGLLADLNGMWRDRNFVETFQRWSL